MERQKPNEILTAGEYLTVYCRTEDKIIYKSKGKDPWVEILVAKGAADYHAGLGHEVYVVKNPKQKYSFA